MMIMFGVMVCVSGWFLAISLAIAYNKTKRAFELKESMDSDIIDRYVDQLEAKDRMIEQKIKQVKLLQSKLRDNTPYQMNVKHAKSLVN